MRRLSMASLLLLAASLPFGAAATPRTFAGEAELRAVPAPTSPGEPSSPERTVQPVVGCAVCVALAWVATEPAIASPARSADGIGEGELHAPRIERPPTPSLLPT